MLVARREMVGGGRSTADRVAAAEGIDGGGAPVSSGRGEVVCELHEVEAKLMVGSAWAEEGCSGGFTAASSLPAFGWSGCVLGCWRQGARK